MNTIYADLTRIKLGYRPKHACMNIVFDVVVGIRIFILIIKLKMR